jgi:hypothetical protein
MYTYIYLVCFDFETYSGVIFSVIGSAKKKKKGIRAVVNRLSATAGATVW